MLSSVIFGMTCYRSSPKWSLCVCSKTMLAHWKSSKEILFSYDWELISYSGLVINISSTVEVFLDCNISQWKNWILNAKWTNIKNYWNLQCSMVSSWKTQLHDNIRFYEWLMFPKLSEKKSEKFGKFRNHLVDFIVLHSFWG